jgi:steroid delta-isomerase-like uncharacterized protein
MSEENKKLERRAIEEVWNQGNYAVVDEIVASDYLGHSSNPATETHGREGVKQFYMALHSAFPDIHFAIEDQVAEGDKVVTRWTARATHNGEYQGIPPTGNRGELTGITIERIAGGKIVECWSNYDELGLLQQLGVIPSSEQTAIREETAAGGRARIRL